MLRTPAIIAFLLCAALMSPAAARADMVIIIGTDSDASLKALPFLPPVPGWHEAIRGDLIPDIPEDNVSLYGGTDPENFPPGMSVEQYIQADKYSTGFVRKKLANIIGADGQAFIVYSYASQEKKWFMRVGAEAKNLSQSQFKAVAFGKRGGEFLRLILITGSKPAFEKHFGAFAYMVSHYAEKAQ